MKLFASTFYMVLASIADGHSPPLMVGFAAMAAIYAYAWIQEKKT